MFKNISIQKKIILSFLPILISSILVSFFIYKNGTGDNSELNKALQITSIVGEQELAMVSMSEALRGYLINPKETSEYDRKKENDAKYGALAEELAGITKNDVEIQKLNAEMAKLDSESLDAKENKAAELIKQDPAKAIAFYETDYKPTRKEQNENFKKLKELTSKLSQSIIQRDKEARAQQAYMAIAFLLVAVLCGCVYITYIAFGISKTTNQFLHYIKNSSDELSREAILLLNKSKELSDSTRFESSAIQETASALLEINQMALKTSDNAKISKDLSFNSSERSREGVTSINEMLSSIDSINNYQDEIVSVVDNSNSKISEIVNVISDIENKTKVINEIVFQTKLLSFNASVEAARAGEHGKGFSVVAEEIGSLASLSGKASEEINSLLASSIGNVNNIVTSTKSSLTSSMTESRKLIKDGKEIADNCSGVLVQIEKSIHDTTHAINEITTAAQEQSRGINEINMAIDQLNSTIQHNSEIAKDAHIISSNLNNKSLEIRSKLNELEILFNGRA